MASIDMARAQRIADMSALVQDSIKAVLRRDHHADDAKDAAAGAKMGAVAEREGQMIHLAALSRDYQWGATEADDILADAIAAFADDKRAKRTLSTLKSEFRCAVHHNVRGRMADMAALRDTAWGAEVTMRMADKAAPTPLKDAFKRSYHVLMRMMTAAKEGRFLDTEQELLDFAAECDTSKSLPTLIKKVREMGATLAEMLAPYPNNMQLRDIATLLSYVEEADFLGAPEGETIPPGETAAAQDDNPADADDAPDQDNDPDDGNDEHAHYDEGEAIVTRHGFSDTVTRTIGQPAIMQVADPVLDSLLA